MQGERANQRNMPRIPAANVCLTTDRGVQHWLLWEPTQCVPVLTAGRRNPISHPHALGRSQWRQTTKRAVLSWSTWQGSCRKFLPWLHMFPPTQLSPTPIMAERSTYVLCTCLHTNTCRVGENEVPWVSNTETALKTLFSDRESLQCFPRSINGMPCGRIAIACILFTFISILIY